MARVHALGTGGRIGEANHVPVVPHGQAEARPQLGVVRAVGVGK